MQRWIHGTGWWTVRGTCCTKLPQRDGMGRATEPAALHDARREHERVPGAERAVDERERGAAGGVRRCDGADHDEYVDGNNKNTKFV